MLEKPILATTELKSLLLAHCEVEWKKQISLAARLQQTHGNEIAKEMESNAFLAARSKLVDWFCDLLARRLQQNQHATPLLTIQDSAQFVPLLIDEIDIMMNARGLKLETAQRNMFDGFLNSLCKNVFEMLCEIVRLPNENPYEGYWRWVTTVLDLATERGIQPTMLLTSEAAFDEITRRMLTKEQYIAATKLITAKFVNIDALKEMLVQPMLDMLSVDLDREERDEFEREIESELELLLHKFRDENEKVVRAYISEEVGRIYGTA
jgi:hypothetical protein